MLLDKGFATWDTRKKTPSMNNPGDSHGPFEKIEGR